MTGYGDSRRLFMEQCREHTTGLRTSTKSLKAMAITNQKPILKSDLEYMTINLP